MRGGLAVRSVLGWGTEFVVDLRQTSIASLGSLPMDEPVVGRMNELQVDEPTARAGEEKPVLLLVEDNEDVAYYIITCLQSDYQIIRADNGQKASIWP